MMSTDPVDLLKYWQKKKNPNRKTIIQSSLDWCHLTKDYAGLPVLVVAGGGDVGVGGREEEQLDTHGG